MPTQQEAGEALRAINRGSIVDNPVAQEMAGVMPITTGEQVLTVEPVVTQDVVKNDNLILSMRMQRTREGIRFYVKSEAIENFIKASSKGRFNDEESAWPFARYKETGLVNFTLPGTTFNDWGGAMYVRGNMVNLSFLRAVGLKDGVDFLLNEMATKEKLERFTNDFKNCVKQFYREFMKPFDIQIDITVEEVRKPETPIQATEVRSEYPVTDNIAMCIRSGNKIAAIAEFRRMYGIDLREAKQLVELAQDRIMGGQVR